MVAKKRRFFPRKKRVHIPVAVELSTEDTKLDFGFDEAPVPPSETKIIPDLEGFKRDMLRGYR